MKKIIIGLVVLVLLFILGRFIYNVYFVTKTLNSVSNEQQNSVDVQKRDTQRVIHHRQSRWCMTWETIVT